MRELKNKILNELIKTFLNEDGFDEMISYFINEMNVDVETENKLFDFSEEVLEQIIVTLKSMKK
jgi:hypothetical protein